MLRGTHHDQVRAPALGHDVEPTTGRGRHQRGRLDTGRPVAGHVQLDEVALALKQAQAERPFGGDDVVPPAPEHGGITGDDVGQRQSAVLRHQTPGQSDRRVAAATEVHAHDDLAEHRP